MIVTVPKEMGNPTHETNNNIKIENLIIKQSEKFDLILQQMGILLSLITTLLDRIKKTMVRIGTWNINSLALNKSELGLLIVSNNLDVDPIAEAHCMEQCNIKTKDCYTWNLDYNLKKYQTPSLARV